MAAQRNEALNTLKGMFPSVDPEVCEAVLEANQGSLEQSLNILLGISDPNYESEEMIPVQTESGLLTSSSKEQIARDEELARSLAAEADKELPVIKEKIVQAADTTKKKVKEWYDKFKQQSVARSESTQQSTPQYTNLPGYEADNPLIGEDFSPIQQPTRQSNVSRQYTNSRISSNTSNTRMSPLTSQPVYGSYGIDVNKDTDDVFSSSTNNNQIKIIREYDSASPVRPGRYDVHRASSEDAEELKKDLNL
ncbi:3181_t:CDS:2 [Funneliformis caledonium]|uniref:3181_t:CDS:1 n=2 Tax=Funneliformis TaxID=1117308 RepID=A0A9N8VLP3_9GLOM|nr:139_t:CDS:2 [Funneliformis mosseae]CAG8452703.1 3181_t:CDS:2 [Funneliformis caledonium]